MAAEWVVEAQRRLAQAEGTASPRTTLDLALQAANLLLGQGAPANGQPLTDRVIAAQGGLLDKREVAQWTRLIQVAQRAGAGAEVDLLDAEQAVRLARGLAERLASGANTQVRPYDTFTPTLAGPRADTGGTAATVGRPSEMPRPAPAARLPALGRADTGGRRYDAPRSTLGNVLLFAVGAGLTLLLLTWGPLILALAGPPWVRLLVWLPALATIGLAVRSLLALGERNAGLAVVTSLFVGGLLGVGWAVGADKGWMPPIQYVVGVPMPSVNLIRPTENARLHVGGRARVEGTLGNGLRVRTQPTTGALEVTRLPDGTVVRLVGGPRAADGYTWWQAQASGATGWVADEWLTPLD